MKAIIPPVALLFAILLFCLGNSAVMTRDVLRWEGQLRHVESLAEEERWPDAAGALEESHQDWRRRQKYLHIVSQHGAVEEAESMYCRAAAFAAAEELSEFQAELAGLQAQLQCLADMERFSVQNIL